MKNAIKHTLLYLCMFATLQLHAQIVHTYYFSKNYEQVKSEKSAAFKAEITSEGNDIEGDIDINVFNSSGKLLQKYSYKDINKGIRKDTLLIYYPFEGLQRFIVYTKNGDVFKDEQYNENGSLNIITRYEGKALIEYYYYYYDDGALHNITKYVRGNFIDSSTTYYKSGKKRAIATYFTNGQVKTLINYLADGSPEKQVVYNEKGDVVSSLISIPESEILPNEADFELSKQITEFKGGNQSLYKYLGGELSYPRDARDYAITGTTYIKFVVSPSGVVSNPSIYLPTFPLLDFEALRVIKGMPDWIIGRQEGVNSDVYYRLPVKFSLSN